MFFTILLFSLRYLKSGSLSLWPFQDADLVLTVPRLCCLLGGLRGPAQSGAPRLRCGMDHRHQFAGGIPHLPAAGSAAVEGESGDHGCL